MNADHAALCASQKWAEHIRDVVIPEAVGSLDLGDEVLEIGPGYGATTAQLRRIVTRLSAVELDEALAVELAERFPDVAVVRASAARLPMDSTAFDAVVCFTMLHHVASARLQDEVFAEARRVLHPGGLFVGSDSLANDGLRDFHHDDIYVPVDPEILPQRLRAAGFAGVKVGVNDNQERFTFLARAAL
ncbi:MAG: class I SAM-dependent methyltransferase [Actinomycetota bacterium]|nr:class I SAM-dependent methyltransferase [Actinomycetota bacterium]